MIAKGYGCSVVALLVVAAFAITVNGDGVPLGIPNAQTLYVEQYNGVLEQQIRDNPVMLYTGTYCGNSRLSKNMFNSQYPTLRYAYLDYDSTPGGEWLMASSVKKSGSNKLPQVYICGRYIGGRQALFAMRDNGALDQELRTCANYVKQ